MLYAIKWTLLYAITHPLGGPYNLRLFIATLVIDALHIKEHKRVHSLLLVQMDQYNDANRVNNSHSMPSVPYK